MRRGVRTRASFWVFALVVLAFIYVPLGVVAIMVIYLVAVGRTGALDNL